MYYIFQSFDQSSSYSCLQISCKRVEVFYMIYKINPSLIKKFKIFITVAIHSTKQSQKLGSKPAFSKLIKDYDFLYSIHNLPTLYNISIHSPLILFNSEEFIGGRHFSTFINLLKYSTNIYWVLTCDKSCPGL